MKERYFYSPGERGFFPWSLKEIYENSQTGWPSDATEISEELYRTLLTGQEAGYEIITGDNNLPELSKEGPDLVKIAESEKARLMQVAADVITPLERAVKHNMATSDELQRLEAWERYSVLLMRVDTAKPEWPTPPVEQAS
ncbi:tail fiber assembly protein [Salmonella enterica]|nr:tail fiber assembly protein [Salmonella enterica]